VIESDEEIKEIKDAADRLVNGQTSGDIFFESAGEIEISETVETGAASLNVQVATQVDSSFKKYVVLHSEAQVQIELGWFRALITFLRTCIYYSVPSLLGDSNHSMGLPLVLLFWVM
jgi:hypothetical protein